MREGIEGLLRDKTRPSRIPSLCDEVAERVVKLTIETDPLGETTHWTAAAMAEIAGISVSLGPAHLARPWPPAAPGPPVQAVERSRVRRQARATSSGFTSIRRRTPSCSSVDEKIPDPGARPHPAGLAAQAGRAGTMTHDYKRNGTTTLFAALRRARRHGARPLHAAPPASGVHPLPQRHRGRGPGRQGRPRHPRQLRQPQAPQGPRLARPPSALRVPLHPDLGAPGSTPSRASSPS